MLSIQSHKIKMFSPLFGNRSQTVAFSLVRPLLAPRFNRSSDLVLLTGYCRAYRCTARFIEVYATHCVAWITRTASTWMLGLDAKCWKRNASSAQEVLTPQIDSHRPEYCHQFKKSRIASRSVILGAASQAE